MLISFQERRQAADSLPAGMETAAYRPTFFSRAMKRGFLRRVSNVGSTFSQAIDSLRSL